MNWISTKERLPEFRELYDEIIDANIMASEPVLASLRGECVIFGYFEKTEEGIIFAEAPLVHNPLKDYEYELDEISHWMPLPEPEKK